MLREHLRAHVNAGVADHDRMTARDLSAALDELLDLVAVGTAERTLRHVAPVPRAIRSRKALRLLVPNPRARCFYLGTVAQVTVSYSDFLSRCSARSSQIFA